MSDAKNIALASPAAEVAPKVMSRFGLEKIYEAARLGFAYAVATGESASGSIDGQRENNFAVGTIDRGGEFLRLLRIFYPEEEPGYRTVEVLMNRGLVSLGRLVEQGEVSAIEDLVEVSRVDAKDNEEVDLEGATLS